MDERISVRAKEAARLLGLSERKFRDVQHQLPHVVVGGIRLFPVELLRKWLEEQAATSQGRVEDAVQEALEAVGEHEER